MSQPPDRLRQILFGTARGLGSLPAARHERQAERENQSKPHGADCNGSSGRGQGEPGVCVLRSTRMLLVRRLLLILLCLCSAAVASAQTAAPAPPLVDLSRSLQELAAKVSPSVVQIFV